MSAASQRLAAPEAASRRSSPREPRAPPPPAPRAGARTARRRVAPSRCPRRRRRWRCRRQPPPSDTRSRSPGLVGPGKAAQVPTRTTRRTPSLARSARTSAALGPPIPVAWIVSSSPPRSRPCSPRGRARGCSSSAASSSSWASISARPGSPTRIASAATERWGEGGQARWRTLDGRSRGPRLRVPIVRDAVRRISSRRPNTAARSVHTLIAIAKPRPPGRAPAG